MRKTLVFAESRLPTPAQLFERGMADGLLLSGLAVLVIILVVLAIALCKFIRLDGMPVIPSTACIGFAATIVVVVGRAQVNFGTIRRAAIGGAGIGAGLAQLPMILCVAAEGLMDIIAFAAMIVGAGLALGAALSLALNALHRMAVRYVMQDGTVCPGCQYCLIGNQSMVCPECGRPFTYIELGTTPARLQGTPASLQQPAR